LSFVKKEILDSLCDQYSQYLRKDLSKAINLVFNEIIESVARNQRVEIRLFGNFELRHQKARLGRNPKSGKKLEISAKNKVHWKISRDLLQKINQDINRDE